MGVILAVSAVVLIGVSWILLTPGHQDTREIQKKMRSRGDTWKHGGRNMSGSDTAVETALEYLIRILRRKSDGRKIQNLQACRTR